jgi:hypothetical protein
MSAEVKAPSGNSRARSSDSTNSRLDLLARGAFGQRDADVERGLRNIDQRAAPLAEIVHPEEGVGVENPER